jgi:hypothetical protein
LKPQQELKWDTEFGPDYPWAELENSDEDVNPDAPNLNLSEQKDSEDEVQILEPSPIPVVDLVTNSEDENEPLQIQHVRDVVPMLISDDLDSDIT